VRETFAGGRPSITVCQCRVSARKRRIWRRQRAAVRSSQREGFGVETVVATVEPVVVVLVVGLGLVPFGFEAPAAAAAVVKPASASRSAQATMKRRNLFLPGRLQVGGRTGGIRPRRAPLGAAYAIGVPTVTVATFVSC
jgi:hypothetical protein